MRRGEPTIVDVIARPSIDRLLKRFFRYDARRDVYEYVGPAWIDARALDELIREAL